MEHAVRLAVPFALAAVALLLLMGLWNMLRGGSPNLSQTLMRWRVVLQFIAICIVMAAIYLSGKWPISVLPPRPGITLDWKCAVTPRGLGFQGVGYGCPQQDLYAHRRRRHDRARLRPARVEIRSEG